jgi:hypothetical protein
MASLLTGLLSGKAAQKLTSGAMKSATSAAESIYKDMCPDISSQVDNLRTADQKHKICKRPFGGPTFYVNDAGVETVWSAGMGKKKRSGMKRSGMKRSGIKKSNGNKRSGKKKTIGKKKGKRNMW